MKTRLPKSILAALLSFTFAANLRAQPNAFTYQGHLRENGQPAAGIYDLRFGIYDSGMGGSAVGGVVTNSATSVSNGLFTVLLDFGAGVFNGSARWLEIGVRTNGNAGAFTTLSPRQPVTPTPYALHAANATALMSFINAPLDIKVNGARALRLESTGSNSVNVVGGYAGNSVAATVVGATIGGGGAGNYSGFTLVNRVEADFGTVGGGFWNTVSNFAATVAGGSLNNASGNASSIGGGDGNTASDALATVSGGGANTASGLHASIGGGYQNVASGYEAAVAGGLRNTASGDLTAVGGGWNNIASGISAKVAGGGFNSATGNYSTVGGGGTNRVFGSYSTVAGGRINVIQTNADHATIAGGQQNTVLANGHYATIGGGRGNAVSGSATIGGGSGNTASGSGAVGGGEQNIASSSATVAGGLQNAATNFAATVAGGFQNIARGNGAMVPGGHFNTAQGTASFAAGLRAKAIHDGAFVWADSQGSDFASHREDQFHVRAVGGALFDINDGHWIDLRRASSVSLPNRIINTSSGAYLSTGGTWVNSSDSARKENFQPVNGRRILAALAALPVSEWNYKTEDATARHIGPTAQDFHAAFGLGTDDKHIATVDADGVALAAIQGLNQKLEQKETEIAKLKQRLDKLEQLLNHKLNGGDR
jgi:hypothetical protein